MILANAAESVLADVSLGDVGLASLVTLFVIMVLTGRLVPRSTVDREVIAERSAKENADVLVRDLMRVNSNQSATIHDLAIAARTGVRVGEEVQRLTTGGE